MEKNFHNLSKEVDVQAQEAQRVPKKLEPRRNTRRHIRIKLANINVKERILKAARGREAVTYKGVPSRLSVISQKKHCRQKGAGKKYSKS